MSKFQQTRVKLTLFSSICPQSAKNFCPNRLRINRMRPLTMADYVANITTISDKTNFFNKIWDFFYLPPRPKGRCRRPYPARRPIILYINEINPVITSRHGPARSARRRTADTMRRKRRGRNTCRTLPLAAITKNYRRNAGG